MDIQMVDLHTPYLAIKDEIDAALQEVIDSTQFVKGQYVGEFECKLAGYLDGAYALGVGSGTDALQIALMALGIGPGDEVITTPFTFVATAEAAALLGATPVFADIDPQTFNLDPAAIEPLITPRTKALVPVHLFGQSVDMDPILNLADQHDLYVVEDNAQAIGATYKGRTTGFLGDVGCLSFFPSKNLGAFGDGGAMLTRDEALYKRMKSIANHGSRTKYHPERVGINSRLDALQAAVLRVKLQYLDRYTEARRSAAARYDALLADPPHLATPYRAPYAHHVFHQYTLRLSGPLASRREALRKHLRARDIPHAVYYPTPLHQSPAYQDAARHGDLPEAERAADDVLSLPMHTELTADQQEHIAEAVLEFATTTA